MAAPKMQQKGNTLQYSAGLSTAKLATSSVAEASLTSAQQNIIAAKAQVSPLPQGSCQQTLTMSFFFDGTGNNLDADIGTRSHSNVARLFLIHPLDRPTDNQYKVYIPGIGTYFRDIGDQGGSVSGKGMGAMGQQRIDWAIKQFKLRLAKAEALAKNPSNKIREIKISVFGFSRGAATARIFCRDLAKLCNSVEVGGYVAYKLRGYPIEISFLGLFDTVASAGLPLGANNAGRNKYVRVLKWTTKLASPLLGVVDNVNHLLSDPELKRLAFGKGGVDPAYGLFDGHAWWADDLKIVPLVKQGLHLVAAHEIRNSFPVDSTLNGTAYPSSMREMIYPGAHSDVGGGYAPNESARSPNEGELLSMIPLRIMYDAAVKAGVPLRSFSALDTEIDRQDFAVDAKGAPAFAKLQADFKHYMNAVGWGNGHIGQCMLAHMRLYFKWRFYAMRQRSSTQFGKLETAEKKALKQNTKEQAAQKAKQDAILKQKEAAEYSARSQWNDDVLRFSSETETQRRAGVAVDKRYEAMTQESRENWKKKQNELRREQAIADTAANDEKLFAAIEKYDQQLIEDAKQILAWHQDDPKAPIRPHYKAIMDAYCDEFIKQQGLKDEVLIRFFDRYVHDSLAGFDTDETRTSDPRVVYIGADKILVTA